MNRVLVRAVSLMTIGSVVGVVSRAEAGNLSGFADFSLNGTINGVTVNSLPTISPDNSTLTLTDGNGGEGSSAFYATPQAIAGPGTAGFQVQFTYQETPVPNSSLADGVTFTLQNDPNGTAALGGGGGGLGYDGIINSASVQLNIFGGFSNEAGTGPGTAFNINGGTAQNGGNPYMSTSPVDLTSGDPIQVMLTYVAATTTLTETLTDLTTTQTFTTSYTADLAAIVGNPSAFIGFTGGTGLFASTQTITDFSFASGAPVPEPSTIVLLASALTLIALKKGVRNLC
jgi:hypothetical protein